MSDIHAWELTNYLPVNEGYITKNTFPLTYAVGFESRRRDMVIHGRVYKLWFGLFEDFSGAEILVYYPVYALKNEIIKVYLIDNWKNKTRYIEWKHKQRGLCKKELFWELVEFVDYIEENTS